MAPPPGLTLEQAVAMQDAIIEALGVPAVQERLRRALAAAGSDRALRCRARQEICLPVQTPVVHRFGFDDVAQSIAAFTHELDAEPAVAQRRRILSRIVDPTVGDDDVAARAMNVCMAVGPSIQFSRGFAATQTHSFMGAASLDISADARPAAGANASQRRRQRSRRGGSAPPSRLRSPGPSERARSLPPRAQAVAVAVAAQAAARRSYNDIPVLSREQALALQAALIAKLSEPRLQERLAIALEAAGDDEFERMRARQQLCLPVETPVVKRFGFEDVAQSMLAFTDELNRDPEIIAHRAQLAKLVSPPPLPRRPVGADSEERLALLPGSDDEHYVPALDRQPGRRWCVVGGGKTGGLIARSGPLLTSPVLATRGGGPARLAKGACVEEIDLLDDRLHYRKVSGEGPDFGWVSVSTGSSPLMQPMEDPDKTDADILSIGWR